ncbi:MAG: hypothetical protein RL754_699 [Bacteroidota bacterium]|jgi:hypothetical protein
MKKLQFLVALIGMISLVSCDPEPTASEVFVREDLLGEWTVSQVAYSGQMPNPLNPTTIMNFSGYGSQLSGGVAMYEMPDTGSVDIAFVAALNSLQVPVSLISNGTWTLTNNDSTLVLDNDSISYTFKMIGGLPTVQVWSTSFMQIPADSSYWADIDLELTLIK